MVNAGMSFKNKKCLNLLIEGKIRYAMRRNCNSFLSRHIVHSTVCVSSARSEVQFAFSHSDAERLLTVGEAEFC